MNDTKLNFDSALDYSRLHALTQLTTHGDTVPSELVGRAAGAEILITKVSVAAISTPPNRQPPHPDEPTTEPSHTFRKCRYRGR
jgi:hypothetical protein